MKLKLRTWRAERDITQSQIVSRIGQLLPEGRTMSGTRYWQIENGEGAEPDREERTAVAAALDVRLTDIEWPARQAKTA